MQRPSESSGKLFRNGVRQLRQKNSAVSGWGSRRQPAQTGMCVNFWRGRSQMRHSSGKTSEKRPCETVPKTGGRKPGNDMARLLLEKTHLPGELLLYNNHQAVPPEWICWAR